MTRGRSWVYFLPILHASVCLASFAGYVIPSLQRLGILFTFVLLADLPISLVAYALGWKHNSLAVIWTVLAGTGWWYLLSLCADVLFRKYFGTNTPQDGR